MKNEDVRRAYGVKSFKLLKWYGHKEYTVNNGLVKKIYSGIVEGIQICYLYDSILRVEK